jgi:hypothetical protein
MKTKSSDPSPTHETDRSRNIYGVREQQPKAPIPSRISGLGVAAGEGESVLVSGAVMMIGREVHPPVYGWCEHHESDHEGTPKKRFPNPEGHGPRGRDQCLLRAAPELSTSEPAFPHCSAAQEIRTNLPMSPAFFECTAKDPDGAFSTSRTGVSLLRFNPPASLLYNP